MTTEDDFQTALDANPDDWQTRLVFADWLQERDDPRAEGYRALVAIGARPAHVTSWWIGDGGHPVLADPQVSPQEWQYRDSLVPRDWFVLISAGSLEMGIWRSFPTRREAEDAAALAFAKLPAARRAELLGAVAV